MLAIVINPLLGDLAVSLFNSYRKTYVLMQGRRQGIPQCKNSRRAG